MSNSNKEQQDKPEVLEQPSPEFKAADGPPPPHEETVSSIHGLDDHEEVDEDQPDGTKKRVRRKRSKK
jgi:hypothetical protein